MNAEKVLADWSDYEQRKAKEEKDVMLFSCDEAWEIYYLKNKIHETFTHLDDIQILEAIEACSRFTRVPKPRAEFVQCVVARLSVMKF